MSDQEEELLEKFRMEDSRSYAFNLLVRKYQEKLYWHIRRMVIQHEDADDILQNVFIKVYRNLDGFKGDSSLFTWLYKIATNESLTFLKRKRRKFFLPLVDVENDLYQKLCEAPYFSGEEADIKLQKAILKLPEKQRLVFNMKYFEDLTYEEISETLNTSIGALKASYHHAVKKIEEYLKEN